MSFVATASFAAQLAQAQHALEQGDLQTTLTLCEQILKHDESCAPAYAVMAELWAQIQNFDNAEKFSGFALKFDAQNVPYMLRNAQFLIILGRFEEALQRLSRALMIEPQNYRIYLLMGDARSNLHQHEEAQKFYAQAKAYSNNLPEIEEHAAVCYLAQNKLAEADAALEKLTSGLPEYARGWLLRGDLKLQLKDLTAADSCYDAALKANPQSYEAWLGKGLVAIERGDAAQVPTYLNKSLEANPDYFRTYDVLGDYLYKNRAFEESVKFYQRTVELNPNLLNARRKLAINLFNLRRNEEALEQIDLVLQAEPNDETIRFLRSILRGETVEQSPREHVANLFDIYADNFDEHLTQVLEYKTPTLLTEALEAVMQQQGDSRKQLSLLDLGCGTGLLAEAAKHLTEYRVGVDLSSRMIEIAAKRGVYAEAVAGDITEYLTQSERKFDLIAAADVLVYLGNLDALFAATAAKIAPSGYFAFSVENGDDAPPFTLRVSGRFAHAAEYIQTLAAQHGFERLFCEKQAIRNEQHAPVEGYLFIFRHTGA